MYTKPNEEPFFLCKQPTAQAENPARPPKKSPTLRNSKDPDYFLESILYKLNDLHNCYLEISKKLDTVTKNQTKRRRL